MSAGTERLERTRLAILEHVHRKELRRRGEAAGAQAEHETHASHPRRARQAGGWYAQAADSVDDWWRRHPARMAVDLARPMLASYARRKPAQYLGLAAVAGAAVLFMRPWKLISVTGVLVALLKSPQMASMVMSALSSSHNPRDDEPAPE